MKSLQIEVYDKNNNRVIKIIARKIDATQHLTVVSLSESFKEKHTIRWPKEIDHWNIFHNLITIYYKDGSFLEISKY